MLASGVALGIERDGVLTPVTRYASGLRFSNTAIGGCFNLSVSLALPVGHEIDVLDRIVVTDATTGVILFDGYAEWPTPVEDNGLVRYELSALGGQSLLSDVTRPHYYCERFGMFDTEAWTKQPMNTPGASAEVSAHPQASDPNQAPAIVLQFPEGKTLATNQRVGIDYRRPRDAGRTIYRLGLKRQGGTNATGMVQARVYTWDGTTMTLNSHLSGDMTTSEVQNNAWIGAGTLASGQSYIRLQLQHTSVGVINAGPNYWNAWYDMHATAAVYRKDGSWREFADYPEPGFYPGMRADMVVEDLLARHLSGRIDAPNAIVEQSTQNIDQLVSMEGMKDAELLDSLTTWEPDFLWQVRPRNASGKHTFEWRKWPTTPRYVLPTTVEFTEDSPTVTVCNRIQVRWRDSKGGARTTTVTTIVPALGDRVRDADPVDLPDGYGSEANAQRIGAMVLAAMNDASTSGTAVVRRPIRDDLLGRDVWPWEIRAGELAWLTSSGEAIRIQEVEYDDDAGSATLRLGSITPAIEQMTSGLARQVSPLERKRVKHGPPKRDKWVIKVKRKRRKKGGKK